MQMNLDYGVEEDAPAAYICSKCNVQTEQLDVMPRVTIKVTAKGKYLTGYARPGLVRKLAGNIDVRYWGENDSSERQVVRGALKSWLYKSCIATISVEGMKAHIVDLEEIDESPAKRQKI